jgi:accessory gene regulator B
MKSWEDIVESMQIKLLEWLIKGANTEVDSSSPEYQKAKYIIAVAYDNISKFMVTGIIAATLGIMKYFIFFTIIYGSIKCLAYGAHFESSLLCLITGFVIYFGSIYISLYISDENININSIVFFSIYVLCYVVYALYAPAVSKAQFLKQSQKDKLKKACLIYIPVLYVLQLFLPLPYRLLIVMAVIVEAVNTLPITFKILERGGEIE